MSGPGFSLDSLFGGEQQQSGQKPLTLDQLFAPPTDSQVKTGPAEDSFFSMGTVGHVLNAFGHGAKQGWGGTTVEMTPDEQKFVKNAGISENYNDIRSKFAKAANEALIRPAAAQLASIVHGGEVAAAGFSSLIGGTGAALQETGTQAEKTPLGSAIGAEQLGHTASEMLEYETSRGDIALRPFTAHDLAKARSLGTVGEGEAGYFDTKTPAPENIQERASATKQIAEAQKDAPESVPSTENAPASAPAQETAAPDIHSVARTIAPDTFQEYDALTAQRERLRQQVSDLGEQRPETDEAKVAQAKIDTILAKVNGVEDKLTKSAAARLEDARYDLDTAMRADTPEMADIRKQLLDTDYRMRDLAPDVASAYRKAREQVPEPEEAPNAAPQEPESQPLAIQEASAEPQTTEPQSTPQEVPAQQPDIAKDVSSKLVNAGRPREEAEAAAALVQAHYEARAARFGGFKGTAQEMYARDAPNIKGAGQRRALEMAQGKTLHQPAPDTEAFKNWFGDSKVLDNEGAPLVVHHGTAKKFSSFNFRNAAQKIIWFTDDIKAIEEGNVGAAGKGHIHNLYAKIEKPAGWKEYDKYTLDELQARGYDGVILPDSDGKINGFVFEPEQLKSVENKGTFSPDTANIYNQGKRGSITLGDARNTIKLFKNADASTFLHETGHHWLEELMSDASEAQAPNELKADAATVRDWLGVKDGEDIPTKGHEKFARGFERYLMEGVAPSKQLASVFAKFKEWLTQIYQTVQRLRSPITEDIRSVFDRLLAQNPERTVIAPERSVEHTMADIHEAEAEHTPPEKAAGVADHIRSEIDAVAKEKVPDIHAELTRAEASGVESADADIASGADEGGPEPAEGASGVGAEPARGNETTPEGAKSRTNELPPGPNDRFGKPESDLVDKAGNIRLDNLNTPEDISTVIRETAAQNNAFMAARRGVLSDGETLDLADAVGMDAAFLDRRKIGQAFNAEQIIAARKLLIKSAGTVRDAMENAAKSDDVASLIAYAEAKDRHRMIQAQVSGITAEAGRALRAFRNMAGMEDAKALSQFVEEATGRTLNQLRQEVDLGRNLQTPAQVSKFINDTATAKFKSMVLEYWINSLISGPITHFRYAVGNAIQAIWSAGIVTPIAATIGTVKTVAGLVDKGDRVYFGEAGAQLFALTKGSRDGWRAGTDAFKSGVSEPLPGERLSPHFAQAQKAIPGMVGDVIRLPGKSVSAIHSFYKSVRYEQTMQALAYRTASAEGLTGNAFYQRVSDLTLRPSSEMMEAWEDRATYDELESALSARDIARSEGLSGDAMAQRVSDLVANPTPAMAADLASGKFTDTARSIASNAVLATKESLRELYMAPTEYGSAMGFLQRAVNKSLFAKIIVPFMKIGSQITRNAFFEMTPLGIVDKNIRDNVAGRNGGAAQDMQLARMSAGVALAGITVGLAAEGLATGDGPEDPARRAEWLLSHKPNTLTIGDVAVPYQGLGSIGMLMRFSANMYATASGIDGDTGANLAVGFLEGASKSVLDENFMRGVKDMLDAIYHPAEYGESYLKGFATNWIPFSVGLSQIARQVDPTMRDTKGADLWDSIGKQATAKIPYLSQTLPPKRDMFGEPITPNQSRTYAGDPVVHQMDEAGVYPGRLERKIRGVDLTSQQYDDYARISGRTAKMQLNSMVAMPGFDTLPISIRQSMIKGVIQTSRESARSIVSMQYPEIIQKANDQKILPLTGAKPAQ